jgi:hypothetical protein
MNGSCEIYDFWALFFSGAVQNCFADSEGSNFTQNVANWRDSGRTATDRDWGMQVSCHRHGQMYFISPYFQWRWEYFYNKMFLMNTKPRWQICRRHLLSKWRTMAPAEQKVFLLNLSNLCTLHFVAWPILQCLLQYLINFLVITHN